MTFYLIIKNRTQQGLHKSQLWGDPCRYRGWNVELLLRQDPKRKLPMHDIA